MKNYAKFSFVMAVAVLSGCRSYKAVEESAYVAADSCEVETSLNLQSLTNIATAESEDSSVHQDHFDFEDGAGIIQITPDGDVIIQGLKSASLTRKSNHKTTDVQISVSDSLSAECHTESSHAVANKVKTRKNTSSSNSKWIKYLFLVPAILIGIFLSLLLLKAKLKQ